MADIINTKEIRSNSHKMVGQVGSKYVLWI